MTDQAPELLPSDMIGDYKALPESFRKHIINLEIFIGDCDNESELDTDGATKALNGIIVELLCSLALTRPPSERPVAQMREALERLRDGGLEEALPSPARENPFSTLADLEAYWCSRFAAVDARIRNIATTALTAERPEAVRENLTAEEFAQVLPRPEAAVAAAREKVCDHPSTEKAAASAWPAGQPLVERLRDELRTLRNTLGVTGLGRRFIDNHPEIFGTDAEIERLRAASPDGQVIANPANSLRSLPESSDPSLLGRETVREALADAVTELGGHIEHGLCYAISSKDGRACARYLLSQFALSLSPLKE